MTGKVLSADAAWELIGGSCHGSKEQGVRNGKHGEVGVDFSGVDGLPAETGTHLLWGDALVVDLGVWSDLKAIRVARDGAEEGRAPGAGRAQHTEHLPAADEAVEPMEYIYSVFLSPDHGSDGPGYLENSIANARLIVRGASVAKHAEIAKGNAGNLGGVAVGGVCADVVKGLCPRFGVKVGAGWVEAAVVGVEGVGAERDGRLGREASRQVEDFRVSWSSVSIDDAAVLLLIDALRGGADRPRRVDGRQRSHG